MPSGLMDNFAYPNVNPMGILSKIHILVLNWCLGNFCLIVFISNCFWITPSSHNLNVCLLVNLLWRIINDKCSSVWSLMSYMAYSKGTGPKEIWSKFKSQTPFCLNCFAWNCYSKQVPTRGNTFDNHDSIGKSSVRKNHPWNFHLAIVCLHVECFAKI